MRYLRRYRPPAHLPQCSCPEGLLRFETTERLSVGWWCRACLLTTLRDEAEIERFLDVYEGDDGLRQAVRASLLKNLSSGG